MIHSHRKAVVSGSITSRAGRAHTSGSLVGRITTTDVLEYAKRDAQQLLLASVERIRESLALDLLDTPTLLECNRLLARERKALKDKATAHERDTRHTQALGTYAHAGAVEEVLACERQRAVLLLKLLL